MIKQSITHLCPMQRDDLLIRVCFFQDTAGWYLRGGLSDEAVEDMASLNLYVMHFLNLFLEDAVPDHSVCESANKSMQPTANAAAD